MIKLNLKPSGAITIAPSSIVKYTPTYKGSTVVYVDDGEEKTVEVYEAVFRIKTLITGNKL